LIRINCFAERLSSCAMGSPPKLWQRHVPTQYNKQGAESDPFPRGEEVHFTPIVFLRGLNCGYADPSGPELEELIRQDVHRGPYQSVDKFTERAGQIGCVLAPQTEDDRFSIAPLCASGGTAQLPLYDSRPLQIVRIPHSALDILPQL
jgi:hypothetical protein